MKVRIHNIAKVLGLLTCLITLLFPLPVFAQGCSTATETGVNLICNGDFELGEQCLQTSYNKYDASTPYSAANEYAIGTSAQVLNPQDFLDTKDHTSGSGNFMAVDGSCVPGAEVWCQDVEIVPNTNYYFSAWVTTIFKNTPVNPDQVAKMIFTINGAPFQPGDTLITSTTVGLWQRYESTWYSGANSGTMSVCIANTAVGSCSNGNDFGLDDIAFSASCAYGGPGPAPGLGADTTICGSGGTLTILSGITDNTNLNYTWVNSSGDTLKTGSGDAGAFLDLTGAAVGDMYAVCVDSAGSCLKTDIINIYDTYSANVGADTISCYPISKTITATLDKNDSSASYTYQWYKDSAPIAGATSKNYTATALGNYSVEVSDPSCGTRTDAMDLTAGSSLPLAASKTYNLCAPSAVLLDAGYGPNAGLSYQWYKDGTPIALGGTGKTYFANTAGSYSVAVTDVVCGTTTKIDNVTSTTAAPVDGFYCNSATTLGVIGSGKYKWFDAAMDSVGVGPSYTTPVLSTTGSVTYYARDTSSYVTTVGAVAGTAGTKGNGVTAATQSKMYFKANTTFTIDSLMVFPYIYYCGSSPNNKVCFKVVDSATGTIHAAGSPTTGTLKGCANTAGTIGFWVELGVTVDAGSSYLIQTVNCSSNNTQIAYFPNAYTRPQVYSYAGNPVFTYTGNDENSYEPNKFAGYFDWHVTAKNGCADIPVRAINNCSLPVELLFFKAFLNGKNVLLNWETGSEGKTSRFDLYRSSDGKTFTLLGSVPVHAGNKFQGSYSFTDYNPEPGLNYYKLVQVDNGEQVSEAAVSSVTTNMFTETLQVVPNPNNGSFAAYITAEKNTKIRFELYNQMGQLLESTENTATSTLTIQKFDIESYAPGMYILKVNTGKSGWVEKIVRE